MSGPGTNDDRADVRRFLAECGVEETPELLATLLQLRGLGRGAAPDPSPELDQQMGATVLPLTPRPPRRRGFLLSAALIGAMTAGTSAVAASNEALLVVSERQEEDSAEDDGSDAAAGEDAGQERAGHRAEDIDGPGPDFSAGGVPPEAGEQEAGEQEPGNQEAGTAGTPFGPDAAPEVPEAAVPAEAGQDPLLPAGPAGAGLPADPVPAGPFSSAPAAARAEAAPGSLPAAEPAPDAGAPDPAADSAEPLPAPPAGPAPAAEHGSAVPAPWGFDRGPYPSRTAPGGDWNRPGWPGGGGRSAVPAPGAGWPGGSGQPGGEGRYGYGRGLESVPAGRSGLPVPAAGPAGR